MFINIIGYIAYGILVILAITWSIGVRSHLDASNWTIFGGFSFLLSAILIVVLQINFLHSIWIIASIFIITLLIPYVYVYNIPVLKSFITSIANFYAKLLRIGLNK